MKRWPVVMADKSRQRKMAANCRPRPLPLRFHPFFQDT
jgi:hypothetical protein